MTLELAPGYSGFQGGSTGQAYNEAAFKYFLDVDRRRVQRSKRSIVLVLVSVRPRAGRSAELPDDVAASVFAGLAAGVREVDFLGWYRQHRIVGAVLPQAGSVSSELRQLIANRIFASLKRFLRADVSAQLHVRVVRLGGKDQR